MAQPLASIFKQNINLIPSSSPAFGTPVHPIRYNDGPISAPNLKPTILPILLPPATLRPHAFRTLTNKYNLNFRPSALATLATFIGKNCGSGWREQGLAEGVLDEVARSWKRQYGDVIIDGDDERLRGILKSLESCMSGGKVLQGKSGLSRESSFATLARSDSIQSNGFSRPGLNTETSFGISSLEVADEEDEDASKDPRDWMTLINAFKQPRYTYNITKKHFERNTAKATLFPSASAKTEIFRQRYHLVHQRILRNESFQPPSFAGSNATSTHNNKITSIANLLGRTGSSHLLLGLLTVLPAGQLALADPTGAIVLDLSLARPVPADAAYYTPGMIVLVDGVYEEQYAGKGTANLGGDGGIGGTIGGKFIASVLGHPPCERRANTLGLPDADNIKLENGAGAAQGPAFGWTDFLGLGSERAVGPRMRRLQSRLLAPGAPHGGNRRIIIASELHLDRPVVCSALRRVLRHYAQKPAAEYPMAVVLMGNFLSRAALSGARDSDAVAYKEAFDNLAAVLADVPELVARTTVVVVPGDNDPWPSAFSAGAACPLPREGVPRHFVNRVVNAVKEANDKVGGRGKRKEGCVEWSSNPGRLCWFGGTGEMVLLRDDLLGRMSRQAVRFKKIVDEEEEGEGEVMDTSGDAASGGGAAAGETQDMDTDDPSNPNPPAPVREASRRERAGEGEVDTDLLTARRLTKTLLDQAHLSPFPLHVRPVHWDLAGSLHLYPLPTALVLADAQAPAFSVNYMGCCVVNPRSIVEGRIGGGFGDGANGAVREARWVEYDVVRNRAVVRVE